MNVLVLPGQSVVGGVRTEPWSKTVKKCCLLDGSMHMLSYPSYTAQGHLHRDAGPPAGWGSYLHPDHQSPYACLQASLIQSVARCLSHYFRLCQVDSCDEPEPGLVRVERTWSTAVYRCLHSWAHPSSRQHTLCLSLFECQAEPKEWIHQQRKTRRAAAIFPQID